jgi:DNA-binding PadR family transcriptional regulator
MPVQLKITDNVVQLFNVMLERPDKLWYGLELAGAGGIGSATVYQALTRMERAGMLRGHWEAETSSELGRPQRRLYVLTAEGKRVGREAVNSYQPRVRIRQEHLGWLPGLQIPEGSP